MVLPEFPNAEAPSLALPLALYDLGAGPASSPGPGAPLALRMFVEAVLSVPMDARERGQPVAMSVSLREFLAWLYPTRTPSPKEYWPKFMAAIKALDSWDAHIPLFDPQTQRSELRRVVSVGGIPRGRNALDDSVRIIVDLPAGSGKGPQVSDNLRHWGVKSATAYRLLINLAYQWYDPGVTVVPVSKSKHKYWVQSSDPKRYPVITDNELVQLAFLRHRPAIVANCYSARAWPLPIWTLPGEIQIVDGKYLPAKAKAIRTG